MTLERSKDWWLDRARREGDAPVAAGRREEMPDIYAARLSHGAWIALDPDSPSQCGVGSTEQEAIDDLMEKIAGVRDISNERE